MEDSPSVPDNGHSAAAAISPAEQRAQLQKILASEVLRNSPGLKKFLDYVTTKTIDGFSGEIKEYVIGTEVLGRAEGYDPKVDTVVRVQANRLRDKLEKYYGREGATDPILLDIPKGHYVPAFSRRFTSVAAAQAAESHATAGTSGPEPGGVHPLPAMKSQQARPARRRPGPMGALIVVGTVVGLAVLLLALHYRPYRPFRARSFLAHAAGMAPGGHDPARALWSDFLEPGSAPMVGYSNSIFLATQDSDLLRVKSEEIDNVGAPAGSDVARRLTADPSLLAHAGPLFFEDLYTGTGEVMATFYLTRMFTRELAPLDVRRGRLVTIDDLSRHDMIFLGSTVENNLLARLPLPEDFVFVLPPGAPHLWGWRIVNRRPRPGESQSYQTERDPKTEVLRTDYALVSFLPGMTPTRRIAVLGGLTTIGTQAAAEFATSPSGAAELLAHLGTGPASARRLPDFYQAVLKVEIMKGDVLRIDYVTGHAIAAGTPSPPRS